MCAWVWFPSSNHKHAQCTHTVICTYYIYIQRKIFFRRSIFLYSPCPNLEGIKDALSYKFRRLTIGQNCVPCAQTRLPRPRGHRLMHSRARASGASAARFNRPAWQATEPRAKREAMSALYHGLVVDSTFEQSENFDITRWVWSATLGLQWGVWSSFAHAYYTNGHSIVL